MGLKARVDTAATYAKRFDTIVKLRFHPDKRAGVVADVRGVTDENLVGPMHHILNQVHDHFLKTYSGRLQFTMSTAKPWT